MPKFPGTPTAPPPPRYRRPGRERETLEAHEQARDAIDLATFRRIHDETMSQALMEAQSAPDEKTAASILDRASASVAAIKSNSIPVQNAYAAFYESSQAGWGDRFARQAKAISDKQTHDKGMLNVQSAIEAGDEAGAAAAYQLLAVHEPESRELYKAEIPKLRFNIDYTQASKGVNSGDPVQIQQALDALNTMSKKGWTVEQTTAWNQLVKGGQTELENRQTDTYKEMHGLVYDAETAETAPGRLAALDKAGKAIAQALASKAINPAHAVTLQNHLDALKGSANLTNPSVEAQAWKVLYDGRLTAEQKEEWFWDHSSELGKALPVVMKALQEVKEKAISESATATVNRLMVDHPMDNKDETDMRRYLHDELVKVELPPEQMYARAAALLTVKMGDRPSSAVYSKDHLGDVHGVVIRGGQLIDKDGHTVPWADAREFYDYMLGLDGLGPQWHKELPAAREKAIEKWPMAFRNYATEKEQVAMMDRARKAPASLVSFWPFNGAIEADITDVIRAEAIRISPKGPITPAQNAEFGRALEELGVALPPPPVVASGEVLAEMGVDRTPYGQLNIAGEVGPEAIPPDAEREVGKTYTFPNGRQAIWRGTGWESL